MPTLRSLGSVSAVLLLTANLAAAPLPARVTQVGRWTELARRGSREALASLSQTRTPEATAALLALLDTTDPERLQLILEALTPRLPAPKYRDRECPFSAVRGRDRAELAAVASRAEFARETRRFALVLLRHEDVRLAGQGAFLITCVGEVEDTPEVVATLDRLLDKTRDPKAQPGYMPGWFDPFLMVSQGQTYRGAPAPENPSTAGEIVVYLNKLSTHRDWRPLGWEGRCQRWLEHPVPYIRHIARLQLERR